MRSLSRAAGAMSRCCQRQACQVVLLSTACWAGLVQPLTAAERENIAPIGVNTANSVDQAPDTHVVAASHLVAPLPAEATSAHPRRTTNDHPLQHPLQLAYEIRDHIRQNVRDYSCVLVKRERIDNRLRDREFIFAKVRHAQSDPTRPVPFGVYLKFLGPTQVKGREVLFVPGENDNQLVARNGGKRFAYIVTKLDPFGTSAMQGNRYPITEIGFLRLADRLIELAEHNIEADGDLRDCQVQYYENSKINDRACRCIEVTYPEPREGLQFHLARVFIDEALRVPVRYEAYDWPQETGEQPPLLEEYTYTRIQLNQGFAADEFERTNVAYRLK